MIAKRLRWYWECEGYKHLALASILIFMTGIFLVGDHYTNISGQNASYARTWNKVEARVIQSEVREINTSDEVSFSTKIIVDAKFEYRIKDEVTQSVYKRSWTRKDLRDWNQFFRPGSTIVVRVSPDNPTEISLVDYNGIL